MAKKVALIIIDGWGLATSGEGNAFTAAKTPTFDHIFEQYPAFALQAAGQAVGLAEGSPGSSEAGHRAIGTGQVSEMISSRLRRDISTGELWQNQALVEAWQRAKEGGHKVHLVGALSDSDNHSLTPLLFSLVDLAKNQGYINSLYLHLFMDGRDTQLKSGQRLLEKVYVYLRDQGYGSIATICGRHYAMSRGGEDEHTQRAAALLTDLKGVAAKSPLEAVIDEYGRGHGDSDLEPTVCDAGGSIEAGDSVIFINHRADRMRPLVEAMGARLADCFVVSVVPYADPWPYQSVYPLVVLEPNIGSVVSAAGKKVTKITETDRHAHLTYFFNGGREAPYYHEERVFVDSILDKITPEQSIKKISDHVTTRLRQAAEDLLIVNVPNMDAAGHTGDKDLAIKAVEAVDSQLSDWLVAGADQWTIIITSDHGNVEYMIDPQTTEGRPEDTANLVPCLCISNDLKGKGGSTYDQLATQPPLGVLSDVSVTVLAALEVPLPDTINGVNLIEQSV